MKEKLLKLLHRCYRDCPFLNDYFAAVKSVFDTIETVINRLKTLFWFNEIDEATCRYWEKEMQIKPNSSDIRGRRSGIRAKWVSGIKSNLALIQQVCDSWENGRTKASFTDGVINITFTGEYGVPDNIDDLKKAIEEVKPAHLGYLLGFKYLLIKDIHQVKTLNQMEQITLNNFAMGKED